MRLITHDRALKAFITARKPRTFESRNRKSVSYTSGDRGARESSSSSADTGEPQTPSPQYSEAIPVSDNRLISRHESDEKGILAEPLDPHFARLLNSLSISASKNVDPQPLRVGDSASLLPQTISPSSRLQTPDWSSRIPTFNEMLIDSPSIAKAQHIPTRDSDDRKKHPDFIPSSDFQVPSRVDSGSTSPVVVANPVAASSPVTAPKSLMSSRRSSSIADISPYLSRPAEVPTSGKRLKQLALLESVADESSKMTPTLLSRELPAHGPDYHPSGSSTSGPPLTSYAPQISLGNSLGSGMPVPSRSPVRSAKFPSSYASHEHSTLGDPFQVRPRPGQPSHSTHPGGVPARGARNQKQSLLLFGGPPVLPLATIPGRLLSTSTFAPSYSTTPLYSSAQSNATHSNYPHSCVSEQIVPNASLQSFCAPLDPHAVPAAQSIQSRPSLPSSSVQLLSILNGDRATGSPASRTGSPSASILVHAT